MGPPRRVRAFVWAVIAVAAVVSVLFASRASLPPARHDFLTALLLAAMIGLARAYPIQVGPRTQIAVDHAAAFAAVFLLPAYLAIAATAIGLAGAAFIRPALFLQHAFNISVCVLAVAGGALVAHALLPDGVQVAADWSFIVAALLTTAAMWSINVVLVDAVIAIQQRRPLFELWWAHNRHLIWQQASLYLFGLLMVAASVNRAWALPLLLLPSFVVYRALRDGVALRMQTRLALEELADIVDLRDRYTHDHCRRVGELSRMLARRLGCAAEEVERIYLAARVHDVGKIGIRSSVLLKPARLDDTEWEEMRTHPEVGARIVAKFPEFAEGRELVLSHHERWDGNGYPRGLAGAQIPFGARVIAVADSWDAMTSNRAYRQAMSIDRAFAELEQGQGTQFEGRVVEAFIALLRERPELAQLHTEYTQDVDPRPARGLSSA
jgi:HD-GYP domain-containing protein (c-di-GMP phosphodiesterase class II)